MFEVSKWMSRGFAKQGLQFHLQVESSTTASIYHTSHAPVTCLVICSTIKVRIYRVLSMEMCTSVNPESLFISKGLSSSTTKHTDCLILFLLLFTFPFKCSFTLFHKWIHCGGRTYFV